MQSAAGRGPGAALGVLAVLIVALGTYLSHRFMRSRAMFSILIELCSEETPLPLRCSRAHPEGRGFFSLKLSINRHRAAAHEAVREIGPERDD